MANVKVLYVRTDGSVSSMQTGDTLAVLNGGTGATTAAGAATNLGLAIGTNTQAWSAQLDAMAALATTGVLSRTGANAFAARTFGAPAAGLTINNPDGVAGAPTFALANDLSALEALASTGFAARTGTDTWAQRTLQTGAATRITISNPAGIAGDPSIDLATLTDGGTGTFLKLTRDAYGRVSGTTAVVQADITGLVSSVYAPIANPTFTGTVTLAQDPTLALQAVTKQYVDAIGVTGTPPWPSVRVVSTSNITQTGTQTIDGIALSVGNRVLCAAQSTGSQNGIWIVAAGAWTQPADANTSAEYQPGRMLFVNEGTNYADSTWAFVNVVVPTLGTTSLTFTQTSGTGQIAAGGGLTKTFNTIDVQTASSARIVINPDSIDLATVSNSASGTFQKLTIDTYGRVTGTTAVVTADITALLDQHINALGGISTTGLYAITAAGTATTRSLTAPAAGITITNPDGVSGSPTFALANDLSALEGLASTGFGVRTGTDTWAQRTLQTGSSTRITISNPAGIAGDPSIDLASGVATPGTYQSVVVDTYGRVTSGSTSSTNAVTDTLTNGNAGALVIGTPVYASAAGSVDKARADTAAHALCVGLVSATSIASAASGSIVFGGNLDATTTQWDAVCGTSGGLAFGTIYYLSQATAGLLTATAPTVGYAVQIGVALSTTKMHIICGPSIQL